MTTLTELGSASVTIVFKPKEGIIESWAKDLLTFSMVAGCVYLSLGSTWWTFVTGSMFMAISWGRISAAIINNSKLFSTCDEAIKYLEARRDNNE